MRRRIASLVAPFALVLATASPASAAPPSHEPSEPIVQEFAAGEVCDFPVRVESTEIKAKVTTFDRRDGAFVQNMTGTVVQKATNLESGAWVIRKSSGPGRLTINDAGHVVIRFGGSSLLTFFEGDVTGPALLYLTGGGAEFEIGDDGFFYVRVDLPAHVEDVCATLS